MINRKNKNYQRYNYQREIYRRGNSNISKKNKGTRFVNAMILVVVLLLSLSILSMVNTPISEVINEKLHTVFSSEWLDLSKAKDRVVSFIDQGAAIVTGGQVVKTNNDEILLSQPVNGQVITDFNTSIKARNIEIQTQKDEEVLACIDGEITNIIASSYGGSRVILQSGDNVTIAYDGIKTSFVKVGDEVNKENIIGVMDTLEDENILGFEVWIDNTPVNPLEYMNIE